MMRTPVAIGSRVPPWPTRRVRASRRTRATTSWEVIPAGLSTTTSPPGPGAPLLTGDSLSDRALGTDPGPAAGAQPGQQRDEADHDEQGQAGPHAAEAQPQAERQPHGGQEPADGRHDREVAHVLHVARAE